MSDELLVVNSLPAPVASQQQWAERRTQFNEFVNKSLHSGVDFGKVPGTDKATLLKPGAEKILQMYGCAPQLSVTLRDQDPNTGYLYIEFTAKAVSIQTGQVVAEGVGSCSSYESKYRWRWENWRDKKAPPPAEQGWEMTAGKFGTYYRRRVENRDLIDQWNTVLKMAKKRALVDLALTLSGASERFTQDVEDFVEHTAESEPPQATTPQTTTAGKTTPITAAHWSKDKEQLARFNAARDELHLEWVATWPLLGVSALSSFEGTVDEAIAKLKAGDA